MTKLKSDENVKKNMYCNIILNVTLLIITIISYVLLSDEMLLFLW